MTSRTLHVGNVDLRATLGNLGIYPRDPTKEWRPAGFAKAMLTPAGPGTIEFDWSTAGEVHAIAWGEGAEWLLDQMPRWCGLHDDPSGFDPSADRRLAQLWKRHGGARMSAVGTIWQELLLVIIGQRVTSQNAIQSWAQLCRRWGSDAPGPHGLRLPPTPEVLDRLSYVDLHQIGLEKKRADALRVAAKRYTRIEEAVDMTTGDAITRITALPGFGPWTATATLVITHGDPDLVMLGDYGMPTLVNHFFTGDATRQAPERGGDEVMLRHLEPWRGHRQRVMKLIMASGVTPPRRAPRAFNPDIRRM